MTVIGRLFLIFMGICAACVAAGLVVLLAILFPDVSDVTIGPLDDGSVNLFLTFGLIFVSGFALVPALIVVLITEMFAIRSALAYAVGGAISGAICYLSLVPFDPDTITFVGVVRRDLEVMTGAGIVAGLVYWLIAGRRAGTWRAPQPSLPLTPPPQVPSPDAPPPEQRRVD